MWLVRVSIALSVLYLSLSGCAQRSAGGGGFYQPTSTDTAGGGAGADAGGGGSSGGGTKGTYLYEKESEPGARAQLGIGTLAAPKAFGSTQLDGSWNVTFSSSFKYGSAAVTFDKRTARIEFPESTVSVQGCPVVATEGFLVELAESGDLGLVYQVVDIKGSASCLGGKKGLARRLLFPIRRVASGTGQFGGFAGEWDVAAFGGYFNGKTSCRLRVTDKGLDGCGAGETPILAWQAGDKVSGSWGQAAGKVEWNATRDAAKKVSVLAGLAPALPSKLVWGDLDGGWNVQFASWANATAGTAKFSGRYGVLALSGVVDAVCGQHDESYGVEFAGSGEFALVWRTNLPNAATESWCKASSATLVAGLRRVSVSSSVFEPLGGLWDVQATTEWNPGITLSVDSSALKLLKNNASMATAKPSGPAISGNFWPLAEFTAIKQ